MSDELTVEPQPQVGSDTPRNVLVLSGGGTKGAAELGCLHYMMAESPTPFVLPRILIGCSIGAVIAVLLAIGLTPLEIFRQAIVVANIFQHSLTLNQIIRLQGAYDINNFISPIAKLIQERMDGGHVPTLLELYRITGYDVRVCVVNLTRGRMEVLSKDSNPRLLCTDALRMACSIPLLFTKCVYRDCVYVDAGVCNNVPIDVIPDDVDQVTVLDVSNYRYESKAGILELLNALVTLSSHIARDSLYAHYSSRLGEKLKWIHIPCKPTNTFDLVANVRQLLTLFDQGVNVARQHSPMDVPDGTVITDQPSDDDEATTD